MGAIDINQDTYTTLLRMRRCIEPPVFFNDLTPKYLPLVYALAEKNMFSVPYHHVLGCYSRSIIPNCVPKECIIVDLHYVDLLSCFLAWYRTQDNTYLDSLCCKVIENNYLLAGKYGSAAFYRRFSKAKIKPATYSASDLNDALVINLIAIMHESCHAMTDFQDFVPLLEQITHDKNKINIDGLQSEIKSDFFALTSILSVDVFTALHKTKEDIIELFTIMMMTSGLFTDLHELIRTADIEAAFRPYLNRMTATLVALKGLMLQNLSWDAISKKQTAEICIRAIQYIGAEFMPRLADYMEEYNLLPEETKNADIAALREEENRLISNKKAYAFPDDIHLFEV